jgi:hypothetical protein
VASTCSCGSLPDLIVIPMRGEGLDEEVLATIEQVRKHGGDQWWLFVAVCTACAQGWMVAQETRIHDNYCLKRLSTDAMAAVIEENDWPSDFLTFEQVLRLEKKAGLVCRFSDPFDPALRWTVEDLRRERPRISTDEIAYLLNIPVQNAAELAEGQ